MLTDLPTVHTAVPTRMPAIFLAHGSPMLIDDARWMTELRAWAQKLPKPKAILMISAHWTKAPVTVGATQTVPLVYDFYGFPERYYRVQYPSPGAPWLAERVQALLSPMGPVARDPQRGLDHGAYIPLLAMYPEADVPVLQVSIPTMDPKTLLTMGQALAPLRDEGVLVVGSGFLTHNMQAFDPSGRVPSWATDFDGWCADVLGHGKVGALLDYRTDAPGVRIALPTVEHFVPVLVAQGAGGDDKPSFPITGWAYGPFTKRSVQFG